MFFMAPGTTSRAPIPRKVEHHLEGTYPEEGVFRVYLFNNFSEPLNAKEFKGRTTRKLGSPKGLLSKTRVCSRSICRRATPRSVSTRWP